MKTNTFGLDISTNTVKVLNLSKNSSGYKVESIGMTPVDPKIVQSDALIDQQALSDEIKKLLDAASIRSEKVNIALPENQVFTRIIEMPELSEQELNAALHWELEQYIPMPMDQVKSDWQILSSHIEKGHVLRKLHLFRGRGNKITAISHNFIAPVYIKIYFIPI